MKLVPTFVSLAALLVGCLSLPTLNAQQTSRPNVILVMADDLGWGDPQCFNAESPIETPNLDEMSRRGIKFNRFYAASSVCTSAIYTSCCSRFKYRSRNR